MIADQMTAQPSPARRFSAASLALGGAAILVAGALGYRLLAGGEGDAGAPEINAAAAAAAGDQVESVEGMIARLEERLRQNPDNAEGWRLLGWSYFELARRNESDDGFRRAVALSVGAYRRASQLEPNNAENWSSLGEALQVTMREVSPEAEQAFQRALQLNPQDPRARYFLAVQKDMRGQHEAAVEDWLALLEDTPAGAPWEADLRRNIQQSAERNNIDLGSRLPAAAPAQSTATAAIPGPTRQDMDAARALTPAQQNEMAQGMVSRLEARLRQNPRDANGWIMLMRSRIALNDRDAARAALQSGLAAFQGDAATQQRLRTAGTELGVSNPS